MKETDYKFWYIRRDSDGYIMEAAIRFYEGEVNTKNEEGVDGNMVAVTRYRRSKKLKPSDLPHLSGRETVKDSAGNDVPLYTNSDFGRIHRDKQLTKYLDKELRKDSSRKPIKEQEVKE